MATSANGVPVIYFLIICFGAFPKLIINPCENNDTPNDLTLNLKANDQRNTYERRLEEYLQNL